MTQKQRPCNNCRPCNHHYWAVCQADRGFKVFYYKKVEADFRESSGSLPMEKDVLLRLGSGMTRKEIAKDLGVSRVYVRILCFRLKNKALQLSSLV